MLEHHLLRSLSLALAFSPIAWALELVGVSGEICTIRWRTFRKWNESRRPAMTTANGSRFQKVWTC
jgi:hypothetical protein